MKDYPEDYTGPKAGQSSDEEWIAVRDYDAYRYIIDGVWSYADFDCYLHSMYEQHYKKGTESVHNALIEFQRTMKMRR